MSNAVIATPEWSDAATITANSEEAAFPVTNLQLRNPTDIFKSISTDFTITLDRGSAMPFNLVSLLFHNGSEFSGFRVRAAATEGLLTSAPAYDSGLPFYEALHFTRGAAQAEFPLTPALTTLTVELGFKPLSIGSQGIYLIGGANNLRIYMEVDGTIHAGMADADIQSLAPLVLNRWYFISVFYDAVNDILALYIDGVLNAAVLGAVAGISTPVVNSLSFGNSLHGVVREFRIWDDIRSLAEISQNFANTVSTGSANLWAYYKMDDGPGASTVITDASPNARHGTITSSAGPRAEWVNVHSMWASPSLEEYSRRHSVLFIPGGISYRWVLINVTDTTNPDGHLEIGRLYVSDAWQMRTNVAYGSSPFSFENRSVTSTTYAGGDVTRQREASKLQTMLIQAFSEEEIFEDLYRLSTRMGIDVLAIQDPDSAYRFQKMIYGKILDRYDVVNPLFDQFETIVRLKGIL